MYGRYRNTCMIQKHLYGRHWNTCMTLTYLDDRYWNIWMILIYLYGRLWNTCMILIYLPGRYWNMCIAWYWNICMVWYWNTCTVPKHLHGTETLVNFEETLSFWRWCDYEWVQAYVWVMDFFHSPVEYFSCCLHSLRQIAKARRPILVKTRNYSKGKRTENWIGARIPTYPQACLL